jgi:thiamine-monophosphate kinase
VPPHDEFELIRVWTEGRQTDEMLQSAGVRLGIGDDTAIASGAPGEEWLLTVDTMVEEVHFSDETMGEADVGYKALAANVSDIAAMGGIPKLALVAVSVPPRWTPERMKQLFDGLYECARKYNVVVVGGDTTSAPEQLVVSVTLIGSVEQGRAIRRDGAKPGQFVFLTGPTGLSAGGLHGLLRHGKAAAIPVPKKLTDAHRRPLPSVKAGRILLEKGWGSALNDVSDGVASEAWEIAEASQVKLILRENDLPLSGELSVFARQCGLAPLEWVLYGGEDYVLLGTADRRFEQDMKEAFRAEGMPLFVIGEVEAGEAGVALEASSGARKPIAKRGYNHFSKG